MENVLHSSLQWGREQKAQVGLRWRAVGLLCRVERALPVGGRSEAGVTVGGLEGDSDCVVTKLSACALPDSHLAK